MAAVFLALATVSAATAQEALRYSLSGQDMAEARKRQLENEKFSVNWGPVGLRFTANLGIDATDNVMYTENNPQADLIFRPQVSAFSRWRVSEQNTLTVSMGLGYAKYINTTDYDRFDITPNTAVSFDIYAGDFLINLHDRFNYTDDVSASPTVSGTGSIPHFENTVGARAIWDMNPFVIASYDHQNYISTQRRYDYLTYASELFTADVGFQWRPEVSFGVELAGGLMNYVQPLSFDNQHVSAGAFVKAKMSDYTSFRVSGGYVAYFVDTLGFTNATSNFNAVYVDASLNQRLGKLLTHTLAFSRSMQPQLGDQLGVRLVEMWRVYHSASWNIIRKTGVNTFLSYEQGNETGLFGETFTRYGAGITLSRQLTKMLSGSVGYQYYLKNSDRIGADYQNNRLVLNLTYAF